MKKAPRRVQKAGAAPVAATPAGVPRLVAQISGPNDLLSEWAALLRSGGYVVHVYDPDRQAGSTALPEGVVVSTKVDADAAVVVDLHLGPDGGKRSVLTTLDSAFPGDTLILTNALTVSVSEQASWVTGGHRLLGIGALPGFAERSIVEVAPMARTPKPTVDAAREFFRSVHRDIEVVADRVGLVAARVICQIINEAAFALQDDIASPQDIDTSMKLGVSYPYGPFEWADRIGVRNVVAVLQALQDEYREERYRCAPVLRTMARGAVWWRADDVEPAKEATR